MMQEQESLHELYEHLPHNIDLKPFVILRLDIRIHVHAQHLRYYTLNSCNALRCVL